MKSLLEFLKTDVWLIISNIALAYAFMQIVVNKYIIRKHDNKMKHYVGVIRGSSFSTKEDKNKEKLAYEYCKTKKFKIIEILRKFF